MHDHDPYLLRLKKQSKFAPTWAPTCDRHNAAFRETVRSKQTDPSIHGRMHRFWRMDTCFFRMKTCLVAYGSMYLCVCMLAIRSMIASGATHASLLGSPMHPSERNACSSNAFCFVSSYYEVSIATTAVLNSPVLSKRSFNDPRGHAGKDIHDSGSQSASRCHRRKIR